VERQPGPSRRVRALTGRSKALAGPLAAGVTGRRTSSSARREPAVWETRLPRRTADLASCMPAWLRATGRATYSLELSRQACPSWSRPTCPPSGSSQASSPFSGRGPERTCAGASSLSLVRGQFLGGPGEGRPHPPGSRFTTIAIASPTVATIPADSLGSGPLPNGWPNSQPASPQPERVAIVPVTGNGRCLA
jgi:hypothetical protein